MPAMTVAADGYRGAFGDGDGVLPALVISASGYVVLDDPDHSGVVMNVRNKAITTYSGLAYNSLAVLNGKLYGANASGVFPINANTDNGVPIDAHFTTGLLDMHEGTVRQIIDTFLSGRIDGSGTITVIENEDADDPEVYEVSGEDGNMHDERIPFAKGHKERFASLRFDNMDGSDFGITGLAVRERDLKKQR